MVVYIIVGLFVLFGLVLAYRTFGGAAAAAIDVAATLRAVLDAAQGAGRDLQHLSEAPPSLGARAAGAPNPAKALRRRLSGLSQQLETIDAACLDEHESGAHALLAVAVDELVWAAGMCADDTFSASEGMRTAVATLGDHARSCLGDAALILGSSAPAEEVERAP
ncbi:MAG: hypothetical protein JOZ75_03590 [Candidatus Dormibacteraeota bacterium]|nr:hypothetical protein [Candidatus Dormibacteraeota bacterium]